MGLGGALSGTLVGTLIYLGLDWSGFTILALFVAGGSALTRLGYAAKRRRGTAEASSGRRGAANALANCSVAVVCALGAALTPFPVAFATAFVASLAAAFADTAESEVGQLFGAPPRLITTFAKVLPGTDGAISLPGTLAGVCAGGLTSSLGLALGLLESPLAALVVAFAAFLGTVADSFVGALAPRVGNELTNVLCTLTAAVLTIALT